MVCQKNFIDNVLIAQYIDVSCREEFMSQYSDLSEHHQLLPTFKEEVLKNLID